MVFSANRGVVGLVAEQGEPARMLDDDVEEVAVQHEIAPAVGSAMNRRLGDLDAAEVRSAIVAQEFVVIAGNVDDARRLCALGAAISAPRRYATAANTSPSARCQPSTMSPTR